MLEREPKDKRVFRKQRTAQLRRLLSPDMPDTFTWYTVEGTKRFFNGWGPAEIPNVIEKQASREEAERMIRAAIPRIIREIIKP